MQPGAGADEIEGRVAPIFVRSCRICRELGLPSKDKPGWDCRPLVIAATIAKSRSPD
jgi:hypothetical protein